MLKSFKVNNNIVIIFSILILSAIFIWIEQERRCDKQTVRVNALSQSQQPVKLAVLAYISDKLCEIQEEPFFKKLAASFYNNIIKENRYLLLLKGLLLTLLISLFSFIIGTGLGGLICYMRMSKNKLLKWSAVWYITIVRGTPMLVLLYIIYYVVFSPDSINPIIVTSIAFGINSGAYVSEMFRTAIESIDKGQAEAGIASGFTRVRTFVNIVMPQAIRRVLPVYKGEIVLLVRSTSMASFIGIQELTKASDIIRGQTHDAFFPLIMAAVIYIVTGWILTLVLDYLANKVNPERKHISYRQVMVKL